MPVASPLLTAMKELGQYLGKKFDTLTKAIKDSKTDFTPAIHDQTRILTAALAQIQDVARKLQSPTFDVQVDTASLESELKSAAASLKSLSLPDIKPIESYLQSLYHCMEKMDAHSAEQTKTIVEALKSISLNVPTTFKLDDMQVRAISSSRMPLNPAPLAPRSTTVRNVSMSSANTEYSITLSSGCTGYFIKLRAQNVILLLATATGKLPTSGDGSAYIQVPQNGMFSPMGMDIGGKTLYLQTASASQVCEVQEFIN